ncbi:MAG: anthranilate synthase component I family protein [Parvularculaceae bacterium]
MIFEREIDWRSPIDAFRPLWRSDGSALLHGGECAEAADWSYLLANPVSIDDFEARSVRSPFDHARALLAGRSRDRRALECGARFASGLFLVAGYETAAFVEPGVTFPRPPYSIPDCRIAAYDAVAAFDRRRRRAFLLGVNEEAVDALERMIGEEASLAPSPLDLTFIGAAISPDQYCVRVACIMERIRNGDLYQANISQRLNFEIGAETDSFSIFEAAAAKSVSAFGAFARFKDATLLSLSPERFFRIDLGEDGPRILAEPIKGTRPRGVNVDEDARLAAELIASAKDRAENIMIADLTRNDLSKFCKDGSIREDAICALETFETVHHLVSRISGALMVGKTAIDALEAMFPCGSITGAPKVEAMKVIAEIEGEGRGPYCGAIGYIDDGGAADFSVGIRLAIAQGANLSAPVGGGVTLQSDPHAEYLETIDKARWLLALAGEDVAS